MVHLKMLIRSKVRVIVCEKLEIWLVINRTVSVAICRSQNNRVARATVSRILRRQKVQQDVESKILSRTFDDQDVKQDRMMNGIGR